MNKCTGGVERIMKKECVISEKKNRLSVEMKSYCRRTSLDDYIIFIGNLQIAWQIITNKSQINHKLY